MAARVVRLLDVERVEHRDLVRVRVRVRVRLRLRLRLRLRVARADYQRLVPGER